MLSQPNATDIGDWLRTNSIVHTFVELADLYECDIVAYDYNGNFYFYKIYFYSGYGASAGSPDEQACYRNIESVYA